jgi:molybdopterin converting factor small subunit
MSVREEVELVVKVTLKILPPLVGRLGIKKIGSVVLEEEIDPGETVESFLSRLGHRSGNRFKEEIFDPDSRLFWPGVVVFVNGYPLHHLQGLETTLKEGDTVALLPPYCA